MEDPKLHPHDRATLTRLCADGTARRLRERGGYSLTDAATVLGVDCETLAAWETGKRRPTYSQVLVRYLRFLAELVQVVGPEEKL